MGDGLPADLVQLRSTTPIRALVLEHYFFIAPLHLFSSIALFSRSLPVVAQIRGHIVGPPPPSPLRYVSSLFAREEYYMTFFSPSALYISFSTFYFTDLVQLRSTLYPDLVQLRSTLPIRALVLEHCFLLLHRPRLHHIFFILSLFSRSLAVVAQIRGNTLGPPPSSPLRCVSSFLAREETDIFSFHVVHFFFYLILRTFYAFLA